MEKRGFGESNAMNVRKVQPGIYSVLHEGRSFDVRIVADGAGYSVEIDGRRFEVTMEDPRNTRKKSAASVGHGRQTIAASMPGKVVRVLVADGEEVTVGQPIIVVEAMKMQNEMKAPKSGRVAKIHVRDGATVAAGQPLLVVE